MSSDKRKLKTIAYYEMRCGEYYLPNSEQSIERVPGGWIFGDINGYCFIPYSDEFKEDAEELMVCINRDRGVCNDQIKTGQGFCDGLKLSCPEYRRWQPKSITVRTRIDD